MPGTPGLRFRYLPVSCGTLDIALPTLALSSHLYSKPMGPCSSDLLGFP